MLLKNIRNKSLMEIVVKILIGLCILSIVLPAAIFLIGAFLDKFFPIKMTQKDRDELKHVTSVLNSPEAKKYIDEKELRNINNLPFLEEYHRVTKIIINFLEFKNNQHSKGFAKEYTLKRDLLDEYQRIEKKYDIDVRYDNSELLSRDYISAVLELKNIFKNHIPQIQQEIRNEKINTILIHQNQEIE